MAPTPAKANWIGGSPESEATQAKTHLPGMVVQSVRTGSYADLQGLEPAS